MLLFAAAAVAAMAAADGKLRCMWNVVPSGPEPLELPPAMRSRLGNDVFLFNEADLGNYPNYMANMSGYGVLRQVGLASAFRDRESSPVLRNESCARCEAPLNTSYKRWQQNYEDWMRLHLAKLETDLESGASRSWPDAHRRNGSVPADWSGLAVLDYEAWHPLWEHNLLSSYALGPPRPCCRFPEYQCLAGANGTGPCTRQWNAQNNYHWALFVSTINAAGFDADFVKAVGYQPPPGALGWHGLAPCEQLGLLKASFDHWARDFFSRTLDHLRVLRPHAKWGLWNYPSVAYPSASANLIHNACGQGCGSDPASCGYNGPGTDGSQWNRANNDELGWLWERFDVLLPDLYPASWVQDDPSITPPCGPTRYGGQWTSANSTRFHEDNLRESRRLSDAQPHKPAVLPYFFWHYTYEAGNCSMDENLRSNRSLPFVNQAGVTGFFSAAAKLADGVIVWGEVQDVYNSGEGVPSRHVVEGELANKWAGAVEQFCRPSK